MGGKKGNLRDSATSRSQQTLALEHQRAAELNKELSERKSMLNANVYGPGGSDEAARNSATDLRITGGFDPNEVSRIRGFQDQLGGEEGYGREGYEELSKTGGFNDQQKQDFLHSAVAPTQAMYARTKAEMGRRLAIQGGYSPGFTSANARIVRKSGQDIGRAQLQGRVSLEDQIRQGKAIGLEGLARTRSAIESSRLAKAGEARALESGIAGGRQQGNDALQRYKEMGVNSITQADITGLQNRLQSGQLSTADSQLLAMLSANEKGTFDKIMQGIETIGGAVAGVAGAF